MIFAFVSSFFRSKIWKTFWKAKKSKKNRKNQTFPLFWAGPAECAEPGGEIERGKSGDLGLGTWS